MRLAARHGSEFEFQAVSLKVQGRMEFRLVGLIRETVPRQLGAEGGIREEGNEVVAGVLETRRVAPGRAASASRPMSPVFRCSSRRLPALISIGTGCLEYLLNTKYSWNAEMDAEFVETRPTFPQFLPCRRTETSHL